MNSSVSKRYVVQLTNGVSFTGAIFFARKYIYNLGVASAMKDHRERIDSAQRKYLVLREQGMS